MAHNRIITLTTDFGEGSFYVASMKGAIFSINRAATVVDVTHSVPQGNILSAAFAVFSASSCFPPGSIHVVVVDPGVGSSRKILAASIDDHTFLAPDNGALTMVMGKKKTKSIIDVKERRYFLKSITPTFHGRDIFAPVAAHISMGVPISKLGPKVTDVVRLTIKPPTLTKKHITGTILYVDSFGNCVSNIPKRLVKATSDKGHATVHIKGKRITGIRTFYAEGKKGTLIALFGSTGFLEVAAVGGSASDRLNIAPPCPITVTFC
jgi:S-adenosylmethionine hydrolase